MDDEQRQHGLRPSPIWLWVETGGDAGQAVQATFMAGVEPHEIAELSGLPVRLVLGMVGRAEG